MDFPDRNLTFTPVMHCGYIAKVMRNISWQEFTRKSIKLMLKNYLVAWAVKIIRNFELEKKFE